jgi:hypothetical protein
VSSAEVSIRIGLEELAWALSVARREGESLSAVVTDEGTIKATAVIRRVGG